MTALVGVTVAVVGLAWVRLRPAPPRRAAVLCRMATVAAKAEAGHRPVRRLARTVVLVGAALVAVVAWPPAALLLGGWCVASPHLARRRERRRLQAEVARGLPDAIDLLVLAVSSGQTISLAIGTVARLAPVPFDAAFGEVVRRTARGEPLADALSSLPERLGDLARPVTAALVGAQRYGVALEPTLDRLATDARQQRRRLAETAARKLPVRLSFPLVCCILPAFGLLTLAPLLAGAVGSLRL